MTGFRNPKEKYKWLTHFQQWTSEGQYFKKKINQQVFTEHIALACSHFWAKRETVRHEATLESLEKQVKIKLSSFRLKSLTIWSIKRCILCVRL